MFNLGAFVGGVGTGYAAGKEAERRDKEEARRDKEDARKQKEQERQDKEYEREDTYRKELEGIVSPNDAHKTKLAEYEKSKRQSEVDASTTRSAAEVVGNPVAAQGITMPPRSLSPASFSESMEQQGEGNPLAPGRPTIAPSSVIAANGIGAINAMRAETAKPQQIAQSEAPAAPGFADNMDFLIKRASIDMKHRKLNGQGMMQLMQAKKQLEDEGVRDALLQIHSGDTQAGIDAFNQYGKRRVKLIDSKQIEAEVGGIKMPTTVVTIEDENGNRQTINAAQALNGFRKLENQLNSALELMKFRQTAGHQKDTLAETRDYHQGVIDAAKTRAANSGGLTLPQQRTNEEIDAARQHVADLGPDEIRRRTQQYSTTGRENPDYDPMLASRVRQANHRKYGEDTGFADIANPKADAMQDIGARFASDPTMKGRRIGNKAPQGVEVFDANGKLIGHYN